MQLPQDLQDLFDDVVTKTSDAKAADANKVATASALQAADLADHQAEVDQLTKHQAATAASSAFVAKFLMDFPVDPVQPAA